MVVSKWRYLVGVVKMCSSSGASVHPWCIDILCSADDALEHGSVLHGNTATQPMGGQNTLVTQTNTLSLPHTMMTHYIQR